MLSVEGEGGKWRASRDDFRVFSEPSRVRDTTI